jgi:hypothetical protein
MAAIAFSAPILPGKSERYRKFAHEVERRRSEYEASRKRLGITKEMAWIQATPQGDVAVVYFEAADPERAMQGLATSQDAFDVWFRAYTLDVHGLDLTQPPPGPYSELTHAYVAR